MARGKRVDLDPVEIDVSGIQPKESPVLVVNPVSSPVIEDILELCLAKAREDDALALVKFRGMKRPLTDKQVLICNAYIGFKNGAGKERGMELT
jgi:hypothetical protein